MRSRANSGPLFYLAGLPRFTCKRRKKRRGWDSNPRDGSTPPTRFPIALLRPTRTPLLMTREEFTKSSLPDTRIMVPVASPLGRRYALGHRSAGGADGVVGARCRVPDRPDEAGAHRSIVEPPFVKFLHHVMQDRRTAGTP